MLSRVVKFFRNGEYQMGGVGFPLPFFAGFYAFTVSENKAISQSLEREDELDQLCIERAYRIMGREPPKKEEGCTKEY